MSTIKRRKKPAALNNQGAKLAVVSESSIERIRERAYELFLARGATHGGDLADWLKAEQALRTASHQH
jgi:hypothetical protein